ncbi:MAG: glycosyltransferase family 39 protein [Patescibacteria group bacterium]
MLILFCFQLIIISPKGDFPLNDDWVHSLSVKEFLENSNLFYPSFLGPFNLMPILTGIAATGFFQFSFSFLRLINILLAFFSVLVFFIISKKKFTIKISFLLSLLFWFNPIFFNLSYTFMGDIMALLLILLAIWFYLIGFEEKKYWVLCLASFFVVLASFTRQVCVLLFFSAWVVFLFDKKNKKLNLLWAFGMPALIGLGSYILLKKYNLIPGEVSARFLPEGWSYFKHTLFVLWDYLLLISLFIVPLTVSLLFKNYIWLKKYLFWSLVAIFVSLAIIFNQEGHIFPALGNMINKFGLGPNISVMQGFLEPWLGSNFYIILHYFLSVLGAINIFILVQFVKLRDKKINNLLFLWLFLLLYILTILPIRSFDRYLLLILPCILLFFGWVLTTFKWSQSVLIFLLVPLCLYSYVGTYNYLAWNKSRWKVGNKFLSQGIAVQEIEGGYEWDGWHLYKKTIYKSLGDFTPNWSPWYVKDLFSGHNMKYIISFSELGGYKVIDKQSVDGIFSNIKYIYLNEVVPHSLK